VGMNLGTVGIKDAAQMRNVRRAPALFLAKRAESIGDAGEQMELVPVMIGTIATIKIATGDAQGSKRADLSRSGRVYGMAEVVRNLRFMSCETTHRHAMQQEFGAGDLSVLELVVGIEDVLGDVEQQAPAEGHESVRRDLDIDDLVAGLQVGGQAAEGDDAAVENGERVVADPRDPDAEMPAQALQPAGVV